MERETRSKGICPSPYTAITSTDELRWAVGRKPFARPWIRVALGDLFTLFRFNRRTTKKEIDHAKLDSIRSHGLRAARRGTTIRGGTGAWRPGSILFAGATLGLSRELPVLELSPVHGNCERHGRLLRD